MHAVLSSPAASRGALGAVLHGVLPGVEGVRWLRSAGLPPTARAEQLTAEQWTSLHATWQRLQTAPRPGVPARGAGGRADSKHGHAPGAQAAPRWF